MAGTEANKITADYVLNNFKSQGLDRAQMLSYDVLLSYPHDTLTNNLEIYDSSKSFETRYNVLEVDYDHLENFPNVSKPFLAYAMNGSVNSDEIYFVNYCRDTDFEELIKQGFNVAGKIVMCKYGKIYRGNKVNFAERYGAKGCLIFDDPFRSAAGTVYPEGEFLPETGKIHT
jgi:N-acetylated-alpha-linked acidic dipeptidase